MSIIEAKGLVTAEVRQSESNRKRRYYSITSEGKEKLNTQKQQWDKLNEAVSLVFSSGGIAIA